MSDLKDARVLLAVERTMLAWNRTSISIMAFGFVIERFGLVLQTMKKTEAIFFQRHLSFLIGESFVLLAVFCSLYSIRQYYRLIRTLSPQEIPPEYNLHTIAMLNAVLAVLGCMVSLYLARGFM